MTVADGPRNMAADETLLETAAAGVASLRFYRWSAPTLSLGYFQPAQLRDQSALLGRLPYVRRLSGGAALVHHHEVTYALALPAGPPWQTAASWLCRMHGILAAALESLGVGTQTSTCEVKAHLDGILCFQHQTPGDLLIRFTKVAGSAQRRQRRTLLQHGAILLGTSPFTPGLPGIQELSGQSLSVDAIIAAVQDAFTRATKWQLVSEDWTAAERQHIDKLVADKYTADTWNRKR